MMLLQLSLHVLIFHLITAKEIAVRDLNYVIKWIEQCPDIGYYFKRESAPNSIDPGACYLCFCHGEHKAVCWRRDNRRCNVYSYHHHGFGKRETNIDGSSTPDIRIRRSSALSKKSLRDASRNAFNSKTIPDNCKPYESSVSDDCPPADWCIGCTVCDCNTNGRWDCHILSFCPENNGNSKNYKRPSRKPIEPVIKTSAATKSISKNDTQVMKLLENKKKSASARHIFKKPASAKDKTQKKKPSIRYQKNSPRAYTTKSVKIIKKSIAAHNPIELKGNKVQTLVKRHNNNTVLIALQMVRKGISTVQKGMINMTKMVDGGTLNRSQLISKTANKRKNIVNPKTKQKSITESKSNSNSKGKKVNKRQIKVMSQKIPPPVIWQRYKRSVVSEDTNSSTMSTASMDTQEVSPIEATLTPVETTTSLMINNSLFTVSQNFTDPQPSSLYGNEYYKYVIAADEVSSVKPINRNLSVGITKINDVKEYITEINEANYMKNTSLDDRINSENEFSTLSSKRLYKKDYLFNTKNITPGKDVIFNNHFKYLATDDLKENQIKLNDWPQNTVITIIRDKNVPTLVERPRNMVKLINKSIDGAGYKNKVYGKDVDRITATKKYKLVKLRNRNTCPFLYNLFSDNTTDKYRGNKKATLQDILIGLLKRYHNDTQKSPKKLKKLKIIRYLKKFFASIFRYQNNSERFSRNHVIETLCENFGPCRVDIKDTKLLKSKLDKLDFETIKILKTVKIIKGLLKLLDGSTYSCNNLSNENNFRNDMHKLNNILNDNYTSLFKNPLSETQLTQINYVKKNTEDLVKSVKTFAIVLNEIVTILTQHNKNSDTNDHKILNKRFTKKETFQNLKYLLVKYDFIQNNFMKKIFETLNRFENKIDDKPKVSAILDLNNSIAIENHTRNVFKDIRQLRHLAQILKSNGRTKREIRDDDAVEYLLMLMEYLLKQNHPLDAFQVNDGIDLLIEAIKNAPDIRTVRKKVLDNTSLIGLETTTKFFYHQLKFSTESLFNNSEKYFSNAEKSSILNIGIPKSTEYDFEKTKDLFDMVDDDKEKFQFDRRVVSDFITTTETTTNIVTEDTGIEIPVNTDETTTEQSYDITTYKQGEITDNINVANIDSVNIYNLNTESSITYSGNIVSDLNNKTHSNYNFGDHTGNLNNLYVNSINNDNNLHGDKVTSNNNKIVNMYSTTPVIDRSLPSLQNERFQNIENDIVKNFNSSPNDLEEQRTISVSEMQPYIKRSKKVKTMKFETLDSYSDNESLDKKFQLEWIDKNFGRKDKSHDEKNDIIEQNGSESINLKPNRTEAPKTSFKSNSNLDVSSISKESNSKAIADEVMLKKQMDLLNSLDYGTERGEFDEIDSKDGNGEDRDSDTFSTYYV